MKHVRSADGTKIAFETAGEGPPLILIGGAFCDRHARASGTPLAALLAAHATVVSYDRRGRGDSTDTAPWAIEREVEDLGALLAEVGTASLYGMSSGGVLAVEAALRGLPVTSIVTYEPPLVVDAARTPPDGTAAELAELCAAGRRSDAAELFLTRVVGVPAAAVLGMKQMPMWKGLESLAPTLSYDVRITQEPTLLVRARVVRQPALVLSGSASPPFLQECARSLAAALGAGRHQTLAGQTHDVDIAALAPIVATFVSSP